MDLALGRVCACLLGVLKSLLGEMFVCLLCVECCVLSVDVKGVMYHAKWRDGTCDPSQSPVAMQELVQPELARRMSRTRFYAFPRVLVSRSMSNVQ